MNLFRPAELFPVWKALVALVGTQTLSPVRQKELFSLIDEFGYLPWSHQRALEELSDAETVALLGRQLENREVLGQSGFLVNECNPVGQAGYRDASWLLEEGREIKLLNLAALGNGNAGNTPGRLFDWLRQLITLPRGPGNLGTVLYLLPFHPREFGCAYIPRSLGVSPALEDEVLRQTLGLDAGDQVRLFLALAQLDGHPTMYDLLPQTGRFSTLALLHPPCVRWFDVPRLSQTDAPEEKRRLSWEQMTTEGQKALHRRVSKIVDSFLTTGTDRGYALLENLPRQGEMVEALIQEGLWPAPGGAWNSSGPPIFDGLSDDGRVPRFRHFDKHGNDVTSLANLDMLAPYSFVHFDRKAHNDETIDLWVGVTAEFRRRYNFDAFRIDHVDHVCDDWSLVDGFPFSYRATTKALATLNGRMRAEVPHYAALAEYMLWDNLWEAYGQDMGFDALWGTDIISQFAKSVPTIVGDNRDLTAYNNQPGRQRPLSILKTYNNQDGEFGPINQYPGQLGEDGALLKWLKVKLLPGGSSAGRPVLYIDGDESFTLTGVQPCIGSEIPLKRTRNDAFFHRFHALSRLALERASHPDAQMKLVHSEASGLVSWTVDVPDEDEGLWIVAHGQAETELLRDSDAWNWVHRFPLENVIAKIPGNRPCHGEYLHDSRSPLYAFHPFEHIPQDGQLWFEKLKPGEFHIYKLGL